MKWQLRTIEVAACALALCGVYARAGSAMVSNTSADPAVAREVARRSGAAGRPAFWRTYDILVDFKNLPRTYTCDQLWYEFRGILLRLGAPSASINVLPYDCSPTGRGYLRSPRVEARFQFPSFVLPGVKGAPITAVERTIRLLPGKPKTLGVADCQLLHQIEEKLLSTLGVKVDASRLDCSAHEKGAGNFALSVSLPVVKPTSFAAAAPPGARAPPE